MVICIHVSMCTCMYLSVACPELSLHVEYAEKRRKCGILFIVSLFCEYTNLEYVRVPSIYRVNQAEYVIHILVAGSQEYENTYSTRRVLSLMSGHPCSVWAIAPVRTSESCGVRVYPSYTYTYIYIHIHAYIYMCIHIYVYTYIHTHIFIRTYLHEHTHTRTKICENYICLNIYVHANICTKIPVRVCKISQHHPPSPIRAGRSTHVYIYA